MSDASSSSARARGGPATARVRIGCHSGFWGDTETAAAQLVRGGDVDYLVSDYLAEVTLSIMAAQKLRNPQAGYAVDFVSVVMAPLAREIADRGIKVITNAGGMNPLACRDAVLAACAAAGVSLRVAVVLGDDLLPRVDELRALEVREMDTGEALPARIASMNAYLGGFPIARALGEGPPGGLDSIEAIFLKEIRTLRGGAPASRKARRA